MDFANQFQNERKMVSMFRKNMFESQWPWSDPLFIQWISDSSETGFYSHFMYFYRYYWYTTSLLTYRQQCYCYSHHPPHCTSLVNHNNRFCGNHGYSSEYLEECKKRDESRSSSECHPFCHYCKRTIFIYIYYPKALLLVLFHAQRDKHRSGV